MIFWSRTRPVGQAYDDIYLVVPLISDSISVHIVSLYIMEHVYKVVVYYVSTALDLYIYEIVLAWNDLRRDEWSVFLTIA